MFGPDVLAEIKADPATTTMPLPLLIPLRPPLPLPLPLAPPLHVLQPLRSPGLPAPVRRLPGSLQAVAGLWKGSWGSVPGTSRGERRWGRTEAVGRAYHHPKERKEGGGGGAQKLR